jgi:hypothetical protein
MAYETFIPTVEAARLLKALEKNLVFAVDCNREYEGEVKERGDSVRILLAGKPQIKRLVKDEVSAGQSTIGKEVIQTDIGTAEEINNASVTLQINEIAYWHYKIGDIDKAQAAKKGLLAQYRIETAKELANEIDLFIAKKMASKTEIQYPTYYSGSSKVKIVNGVPTGSTNQQNILDFIDGLVEILNTRDVNDSTELVLECSPKFWRLLKKEYRDLDTDNSFLLAGRRLGRYNDITIKKTNNCKWDSKEFVFIRTKRAVAFVNPLTHTEPYRPEKGFADAVKGFSLFDADIIRPKEVISIEVEY